MKLFALYKVCVELNYSIISSIKSSTFYIIKLFFNTHKWVWTIMHRLEALILINTLSHAKTFRNSNTCSLYKINCEYFFSTSYRLYCFVLVHQSGEMFQLRRLMYIQVIVVLIVFVDLCRQKIVCMYICIAAESFSTK